MFDGRWHGVSNAVTLIAALEIVAALSCYRRGGRSRPYSSRLSWRQPVVIGRSLRGFPWL